MQTNVITYNLKERGRQYRASYGREGDGYKTRKGKKSAAW